MHDAWCNTNHDRAGLVSNQPRGGYIAGRPLGMVSVCDLPKCIAKGIKYVAGNTNETATYQPDGA